MRNLACLAFGPLVLAACGYKPGPEVADTRKNMIPIVKALTDYKKDLQKFPPTLADLSNKPPAKSPEEKKWKGPYLKVELPRDGWGNPFVYNPQGTGGAAFDLISYGADGKEGGKNDDQDIAHDPRSLPKPKK